MVHQGNMGQNGHGITWAWGNMGMGQNGHGATWACDHMGVKYMGQNTLGSNIRVYTLDER